MGNLKHQWTTKGRWHVIGNTDSRNFPYIHRDDECTCGCVRRIVINEEGKEWVESYTINDDVTIIAPPCRKFAGYVVKKKHREPKIFAS